MPVATRSGRVFSENIPLDFTMANNKCFKSNIPSEEEKPLEPKPKRDFTPLERFYESAVKEFFKRKFIVLPESLLRDLPF